MPVHCNVVNIYYEHDIRFLYKFAANKSFGQLLDILPKSFIFSKTFNSGFSCIEVWFTGQNSRPLEMEDNINITLVINWPVRYKKWLVIQVKREKILVKGYYEFLSFAKTMSKNINKNSDCWIQSKNSSKK